MATNTVTRSFASLVKEFSEKLGAVSDAEMSNAILDSLSEEEQLFYFRAILPAYVSSKRSYANPLVSDQTFPEAITDEAPNAHLTIKKKGQNKFFAWDKLQLSTGLKPGEHVVWPDFTRAMAEAKIELLTAKIAKTVGNRSKYEAIVDALTLHKVDKIGDLPAQAKKNLESALGSVPKDD